MKLSLTLEELELLISELKQLEEVRFVTTYEKKLSALILKEFIFTLMSKFMKQKENYKIDIDQKTLYVLNCIMPQIRSDNTDAFSEMTIRSIYQQINKACLSI